MGTASACGGESSATLPDAAASPDTAAPPEVARLVTQVVAGAHHTCALHQDHTVSCWGLAESINGGGDAVLPPREIDVAGATTVSAGMHQTCAVVAGGRVRCWGNRSFEVAKEDGTPLTGASEVAVGGTFGCATAADGTYCWGKNDLGQLARPLMLEESARALLALPGRQRFLGAGDAVIVHDGADRICAWGSNGSKQIADDDLTTVFPAPRCAPLADVVQLAVGSVHACVRRARGTFACWGERYYGQLGIGGTVDDTLDVPPYGSNTALPAAVTSLVAGASHTCALVADGTVSCFGLNSKGQVGPGATTSIEEVRAPVAVSGLAGRVVSLGAGSTAQHTCAVLAGGAVQCWGSNSDGQLGDGVTTRDATRFSQQPVTVRW